MHMCGAYPHTPQLRDVRGKEKGQQLGLDAAKLLKLHSGNSNQAPHKKSPINLEALKTILQM